LSALGRVRMKKIQKKERKEPRITKSGDPTVNLNCKVRVRTYNAQDASVALVVCRHFAEMFAKHQGKKSELIQQYGKLSDIRKAFKGKLANIHEAYHKSIREADPGCKHVVSSQGLGAYLHSLAKALEGAHQGGGPSEVNCLLLTADHSMAIHVQRKHKDGVDYFAAKLFDPNVTASYKRAVALHPEDLSGLQLQDMLVHPEVINSYAPPGQPVPMVAVCLDNRVHASIDRSSTAATPGNMDVALCNGVPDEVRAMLRSASPETHFDLLQAKSSLTGIPGLNRALQDGHTDTVRVFMECVGALQLPDDKKLELLVAKRPDGVPGLSMALQKGHADTVSTFVESIVALKLSDHDKIELLAAKRADGKPGLFMAFQEGQTEAVTEFVERVLASELPDDQKLNLLVAKEPTGNTGLQRARANAHSETVNAFVNKVQTSRLPQEMKDALLKL
jgi:ShET2 enterotoxin, N-terminal region